METIKFCTWKIGSNPAPNNSWTYITSVLYHLNGIGHTYVVFEDDSVRGFHVDPEDHTWTVRDDAEGQKNSLRHYCLPRKVSSEMYNCLKRKMALGNKGTKETNSVVNNCGSNIINKIKECKEELKCEEQKEE